MTNKELINIYKNYKSLLSTTTSDIVAFKESWSDEFCRQEINRVYTLLTDELMCMPTWALDCLREGSEVWSINGKRIITLKSDKLSKDTRFGISAYGFKKSQLRDSKLNSILDE